MELKLDTTEAFEQQLKLLIGNLLAETFEKAKQSQTEACEYITGKQTAAYLNISIPTLNRFVEEFGLRTIKLEGMRKTLFNKSTVDDFMKSFEY